MSRSAPLAALAAAVLCAPKVALAAEVIRTPGDHPSYSVEVEPHLLFGWNTLFPGDGFGGGARVSIPVVQNGFIQSLNDSVAVTFGLDVVHYDGCYIPRYSCTANYLLVPAAVQWNFYVARQWSVFGEPGFFVYHGFFDACPAGYECVNVPNATSVQPAVFVGGRYHFSESTSLTMRLGYPTVSFGVSFL
jgi:hypothetical protein